jgi:acyl-CoA dehydrogenase
MAALDIDRGDLMKEEDIVLFEQSAAKFLDQHAPPERVARWDNAGVVEREMWREAGDASLLCLTIPEAHGGAGGDFRHEAILIAQLEKKGGDSPPFIKRFFWR